MAARSRVLYVTSFPLLSIVHFSECELTNSSKPVTEKTPLLNTNKSCSTALIMALSYLSSLSSSVFISSRLGCCVRCTGLLDSQDVVYYSHILL